MAKTLNNKTFSKQIYDLLSGTYAHLKLVNDWEYFEECDTHIRKIIFKSIIEQCPDRKSKFKVLHFLFPKRNKGMVNRLASALQKGDLRRALGEPRLDEIFILPNGTESW